MFSLVECPVFRSELAEQGVVDLEHVHAVKAGIKPLVALVVCHGVQHCVVHDLVVIAVQSFSDQEKILLLGITEGTQPP